MKMMSKTLLGAIQIGVLVISMAAMAEQIPLKAWIHDPVIDSVEVSPSGQHLAGLTLVDVNKSPEITVWDTSDLAKPPVRFSPKDIKPLFVGWLNADKLLVYGRQAYDYRFSGRNTKWFRDKVYIVDRQGKKFREILQSKEKIGAGLVSRLPLDENHILVSATTLEGATDYYKVDLKKFGEQRIYRGSPKTDAMLNVNGEVVGKTQVIGEGSGARIEFSYKDPKTGEWDVHQTWEVDADATEKNRESIQPVGFDLDGRTVYVTDNVSTDKTVLKKYDIVTRKLSEPIFGGEDFEARGVMQSDEVANYGEVVGYIGEGARSTRVYTDPKVKALYEQISAAFPEDDEQQITSMSDDQRFMVIRNSGVKEPGSYYLFKDRKELLPLGRSFPYLDPAKLSDMKYVEYKARDGLTIPAYLTTPKEGKAPYPTVIMPHGGPWARDRYGWDRWVQFLANRGYAVLQPQYRGSDGWGKELWIAGDREWGQKMQDDKDDGAAWLVEQGIAAKDRIAMYGYSYGGFAAMAAVVRENSPYQCAISGAGLSELRTFDKLTFGNPIIRALQNPTIDGMSPYDNVEKANIPLYIFHGDRDQRVPVDQSRKYYKALKKAGKTVEYNEIPDLWHSNPWFPTHHINVLGNLEEYLAERCGPGGL